MSLRAWATAAILTVALTGCSIPSLPTVAGAPATVAATASDATDPATLTNSGWKITTFTMKPDGAGNFGAIVRIQNTTGADKKAAAFTVTVLDSSKAIVTTLIGSATSIAKDATVTVQLVSTDKYTAGAYLYAFQVDASY